MNLARRRVMTNKTDDGVLWLYKEGDECVDVTGGWVIPSQATGSVDSASDWSRIDTKKGTGDYIYTKELDYLYLRFTATSGSTILGSIHWMTANGIDFFKYSKLNIEVTMDATSNTSNFNVCIDQILEGKASANNSGYKNQCAYYLNQMIDKNVKTKIVKDISMINGTFKIALGKATYTSASTGKVNCIKIHNVWLSTD